MNDLDIALADAREIGKALWVADVRDRSPLIRRIQKLRPDIPLVQGKGLYLLRGSDGYEAWAGTGFCTGLTGEVRAMLRRRIERRAMCKKSK